jgi:hypothetical protein
MRRPLENVMIMMPDLKKTIRKVNAFNRYQSQNKKELPSRLKNSMYVNG